MIRLLLFALTATLFAQEIPADKTITPEQFNTRLAQKSKNKPLVLQTGFYVLFRGAHVTDSIYAGPGSKSDGIENLKETVAKEPRDREIIIYCGCCPWDKCPNMKPAFAALREMGFTKVSAVQIPDTLAKDWIAKGYPTEKRAQ